MSKQKRPNFFIHLHPPKFNAREASFFYTFGLGGISIFLFIVLLLTGILEVFYYIPSAEEANRSLQVLTFLVPYGRLVRGLHYWAAQLMVVTALLHLLRVVFTGAYKAPRRFNWILGMVLLLTVLFFDFTGYGLRWDEDISWAILVGTNLLKLIPLIGDGLYQLFVGGEQINAQTLVRFYAWHIYGLSIVAFVFIAWHVFRVRRDGGISAKVTTQAVKKVDRYVLNRRENIAMFIVTALLLGLAYFFPPALGAPADYNNIPEQASAPWFFIWVQQLLLRGDALWMGVLIPLLVLVLLFLLPYLLDRKTEGVGEWFNRSGRLAQLITLLIVLAMSVLTIIGGLKQ